MCLIGVEYVCGECSGRVLYRREPCKIKNCPRDPDEISDQHFIKTYHLCQKCEAQMQQEEGLEDEDEEETEEDHEARLRAARREKRKAEDAAADREDARVGAQRAATRAKRKEKKKTGANSV